ncbi:hypothetical protein DFQ30_000315 [Apophysomyces sp. BC1015]|nr:hypothetical protein DFQ30_000315 [Apophysomyces sp. BC1015]
MREPAWSEIHRGGQQHRTRRANQRVAIAEAAEPIASVKRVAHRAAQHHIAARHCRRIPRTEIRNSDARQFERVRTVQVLGARIGHTRGQRQAANPSGVPFRADVGQSRRHAVCTAAVARAASGMREHRLRIAGTAQQPHARREFTGAGPFDTPIALPSSVAVNPCRRILDQRRLFDLEQAQCVQEAPHVPFDAHLGLLGLVRRENLLVVPRCGIRDHVALRQTLDVIDVQRHGALVIVRCLHAFVVESVGSHALAACAKHQLHFVVEQRQRIGYRQAGQRHLGALIFERNAAGRKISGPCIRDIVFDAARDRVVVHLIVRAAVEIGRAIGRGGDDRREVRHEYIAAALPIVDRVRIQEGAPPLASIVQRQARKPARLRFAHRTAGHGRSAATRPRERQSSHRLRSGSSVQRNIAGKHVEAANVEVLDRVARARARTHRRIVCQNVGKRACLLVLHGLGRAARDAKWRIHHPSAAEHPNVSAEHHASQARQASVRIAPPVPFRKHAAGESRSRDARVMNKI